MFGITPSRYLNVNVIASRNMPSVFRTEAWVQAWVDIWGNHSAIRLMDLGGRKNPLEYVYTEKRLIRKLLPVTSLHLAGVGCSSLHTPRSEYNDVRDLISLYGNIEAAGKALASLDWQEFILPDVVDETPALHDVECVAKEMNAYVCLKKVEPAYHVISESFEGYLMSLGGNTRLKYFNRRERLSSYGEVEKINYPLHEVDSFFKILNEFHVKRWGRPCYSLESQNFMRNFQERLVHHGGQVIMEALLVSGEIVSVIFDICWAGKRYNLQSGYAENRFPKVALGALHLGYSIEAAIKNKQIYDFMAGVGKNADYKANIANSRTTIKSVSIQRSYVKLCHKLIKVYR